MPFKFERDSKVAALTADAQPPFRSGYGKSYVERDSILSIAVPALLRHSIESAAFRSVLCDAEINGYFEGCSFAGDFARAALRFQLDNLTAIPAERAAVAVEG